MNLPPKKDFRANKKISGGAKSACPNCGYCDPVRERELARLRDRARVLGIHADGPIKEREAAELVEIPFETFRHYRKGETPESAPCRYVRNRAKAISYRIEDLADFCAGEGLIL